MSRKSGIEWTQATWNPVTGCTPISPGCKNCYAERMSKRFAGRKGWGTKKDPFKVTLHPDRLDEPLHWKKPRRIFVCSMSDLFHEDVPDDFINMVFDTIRLEGNHHTYIILTKRPENANAFTKRINWRPWPNNIWLGVTAENQEQADKRIPILLQIPAAVRFVSIEPMLGAVENLHHIREDGYIGGNATLTKLDWVIVGGESGPGARPMNPEWARSVRDQCKEASVPFFFKQWGEWCGALDAVNKFPPIGASKALTHIKVWFKNRRRDEVSLKIGKKIAGRLLDGKLHNEYPEAK